MYTIATVLPSQDFIEATDYILPISFSTLAAIVGLLGLLAKALRFPITLKFEMIVYIVAVGAGAYSLGFYYLLYEINYVPFHPDEAESASKPKWLALIFPFLAASSCLFLAIRTVHKMKACRDYQYEISEDN